MGGVHTACDWSGQTVPVDGAEVCTSYSDPHNHVAHDGSPGISHRILPPPPPPAPSFPHNCSSRAPPSPALPSHPSTYALYCHPSPLASSRLPSPHPLLPPP